MLSLHAFEASARHLSFTRAGEELHLSQSAVSRQVIDLERFLNVALFARIRRRIQLTAAGENYLARVRTALDALEAATFDLRAHGGSGGVLNISIPSTWGNKWLMPRMPDFVKRHPDVVVNLSTKVGKVDFSDGALDGAVVFGDGEIGGTDASFIMPLELSPIASPALLKKHKRIRTAADLLNLPRLHQMTVPQAWQIWFASQGLESPEVNTGARYALLSMGMQATLAGLGVALLPDYLVEEEIATGRLRRAFPANVRVPEAYWFHGLKLRSSLPALNAFRDWLIDQSRT
jgi:LysR family transcriptional regulator, glycine cleavage system transcriptional activator